VLGGGVRLSALLQAVPAARLAGPDQPEEPTLHDVTLDSREAGPGVLFACRPGERTDGHVHAPAAVAAGAPALLVERVLDLDVPQLVVPRVADAVGEAAAAVHGHPSSGLALAGVTGTNGKTTTTYLIEAALRGGGHRTGLIGTIQTLVDGAAVPGVRTTPESTDLQRLFARMAAAGVTAAAMEVSSHGLALGRIRGTRFGVAAFTNLTQDHLDFHRDLEDYFAAKASLFDPRFTPHAVVNIDDPYGARLAVLAAGRGLAVDTVSPGGAGGAAVLARDVRLAADGSDFTAVLHGEHVPVHLGLPGAFNVANALVALACAVRLGVDVHLAVRGIEALDGVPGRMERVEAGQPFAVLVDYAHTPDSVEKVLRAARELTAGRLLVVVGCGGDRDRAKRGPMGAAAATFADHAVFTSDNSRSEDLAVILDAMVEGARATGGAWSVEPDREAAIALALDAAGPGDVVVIAGKGHEVTQEFADRIVPFDDRAVARALLAARWGGGP
jgi:UDP-N-acetylmuramoyl-L-alanyl-D-glutamate--2,6-diaminopimelate ligase